MQRYTVFFIIVNAVHVSGGFSSHQQASLAHTVCTVLELLMMGGETARDM